MTSDIHLAFAHPVERSEATAGDPRDRLSLRDHVVEVEIGAFQSERGATQRVRFNVVVELRPGAGPQDDDVDTVLSYDTITDSIAAALAEERLNLLETLAERIAALLLAEKRAERVFVRVEKLDRGPGALGVEIVRSRVPDLPPVAPGPAAQPVVVYLSNAAIAAPALPSWLDRLQARGLPVILCVGPSEVPAPQADGELAQRRIDLLAIEQNAWVLSGRDARCLVVGTRTELDHAVKHRQICVWAPSKIVLDAVDGPPAGPRDAAALALWLCSQAGAAELVVIGARAPAGAALPVLVLGIDEAGAAL